MVAATTVLQPGTMPTPMLTLALLVTPITVILAHARIVSTAPTSAHKCWKQEAILSAMGQTMFGTGSAQGSGGGGVYHTPGESLRTSTPMYISIQLSLVLFVGQGVLKQLTSSCWTSETMTGMVALTVSLITSECTLVLAGLAKLKRTIQMVVVAIGLYCIASDGNGISPPTR